MNYNELIQLYFERSNALQNYWTVYVVIIGGLLAVSSLRKERNLLTTTLVTVLFSFFAYKNLDAIHDVTLNRFAVLEAIKQLKPATPEATAKQLIDPTLNPPAFEGVRSFHITSDVLTILAMWSMERRRRQGEGSNRI